MPEQPRTLSYVGGPWAKAGTVTIPAHLVVDRRELPDDGGAYVLAGDTYTWTPDRPQVQAEAEAEERPAEPATTEETRPAPEQPLHERPAPARRSRRPSSTKD